MSELRQKMMQDMALAGYRPKTQKTYLESIRMLAKFYRRSPDTLTQEDLRGWARHLLEQGSSSQRLRQHFAALKCLYVKTLARPQDVAFLSWPRDIEKLPEILSADEVGRLLAALTTPAYRVLHTTIYATGLRIGEALRLETRDIDAARGVIQVRHGKGGKERLVMLSPRLLAILRAFLRRFLLHVLPDGFKKIRHSGLYAGAHVDTLQARAHCLLAPTTAPRMPASDKAWAEALLELTGRDVDRCRVCGGLVDHIPLARAPPRGGA